jgi:hypothetical protein
MYVGRHCLQSHLLQRTLWMLSKYFVSVRFRVMGSRNVNGKMTFLMYC